MNLSYKNLSLKLITLLAICAFMGLGMWQYKRARQKEILIKHFKQRIQMPVLFSKDLNPSRDLRFFKVQLKGRFDNAHTFLLDNKIFHGQVGYEIYTPFYAKGMRHPLLVDRGFMPIQSRQVLPQIPSIKDKISITGMLNQAPRYVSFGTMLDQKSAWPKRIEFIDLKQIASLIQKPLFPYVLMLQANASNISPIEQQVTNMPPERHMGYAVQWFALALTLLILFVALSWDRRSKPKN